MHQNWIDCIVQWNFSSEKTQCQIGKKRKGKRTPPASEDPNQAWKRPIRGGRPGMKQCRQLRARRRPTRAWPWRLDAGIFFLYFAIIFFCVCVFPLGGAGGGSGTGSSLNSHPTAVRDLRPTNEPISQLSPCKLALSCPAQGGTFIHESEKSTITKTLLIS